MNKHSFIFLFLSLVATTIINILPAFAKSILTNSSMKKASEGSKQLWSTSIDYHFMNHQILTALKSTKSATQAKIITDGKYLSEQNLFEVNLQVQGDQFRLQEAGHRAEQWQSISKLQHVRSGIVYFDGLYWCSEQAPRLHQNSGKPISIYQGISRACTANGWVEK
jgi:hypothetical protein